MRSNSIAIVALSAALLATSCQKRARVAALPPPPPPAPVAVAPSAMDQAERAFTSGNYEQAALGYENYLRTAPAAGQRDQALFHLGMSYVLRTAPAADWQRAVPKLKELVDTYPNSPYKPPAALILSLHSELDQAAAESKLRDQRLKQLTTELDRLKKIDADRRRRP